MTYNQKTPTHHQKIRIETFEPPAYEIAQAIIDMKLKYPNDQDLGKHVREYLNKIGTVTI
jgi:hypothetical protein